MTNELEQLKKRLIAHAIWLAQFCIPKTVSLIEKTISTLESQAATIAELRKVIHNQNQTLLRESERAQIEIETLRNTKPSAVTEKSIAQHAIETFRREYRKEPSAVDGAKPKCVCETDDAPCDKFKQSEVRQDDTCTNHHPGGGLCGHPKECHAPADQQQEPPRQHVCFCEFCEREYLSEVRGQNCGNHPRVADQQQGGQEN